ncbi:T9SS type A sorting domain-containing protein [Bacteroidota bacterium]
MDWVNPCIPNGQILSINGDYTGNVWAGSNNKIIKFQGNQCVIYPNIPWYITSIVFNQNNTPFALANEYLIQFNGITWDTILQNSKIGSGRMFFDQNDTLWIAAGTSLFKFNGNGLDTFAIPASLTTYSYEYTREFMIDQSGNKWFCNYYAKGIYRFDGIQWTKYSPNSQVISVTIDTIGNVWYNDSSGFIRDNGVSLSKYNHINSCIPSNIDYISAKIVAEDDYIWIIDIANDRIVSFKPGSCNTYNYLGFQAPPWSNMIGQIYNSTNMWIVLDSAGISVFGKGAFNNINGFVFHDTDLSGTLDSGEYTLPHQKVYLSPNNALIFTDSSGHYSYNLWAQNGTYEVVHNTPMYYSQTTPDTLFVTQTYPDEESDSVNFGQKITSPIKEIEISITANNFTPGQQATYWINLVNNGNMKIDSGTFTLDFDSTLTYISSIPTAVSILPGYLSWKYYDLFPQEIRNIKAVFYVDTTTIIGTSVLASAIAYPITGDYIPANNIFTLIDTITGPIDPNDKQVSPRGFGPDGYISNDDSLNYTIRFQNVGTDTAINIRIEDHLSNNLNINSFEVKGYSHPCRYKIKNISSSFQFLYVYFDNINLPDSNANYNGSCGYFKYRISPKSSLPDNTTIYNYAYIYFDYNLPEYTNFVLNTINNLITDQTAIESADGLISVYPNPVYDQVFLEFQTELKNEGVLDLYNVLGEKIKSVIIPQGTSKMNIDVASFSQGFYIYRIHSGRKILESNKFLKLK